MLGYYEAKVQNIFLISILRIPYNYNIIAISLILKIGFFISEAVGFDSSRIYRFKSL